MTFGEAVDRFITYKGDMTVEKASLIRNFYDAGYNAGAEAMHDVTVRNCDKYLDNPPNVCEAWEKMRCVYRNMHEAYGILSQAEGAGDI